MKKLYFVTYGPNESHLCEAAHFERLRGAIDFAISLPATNSEKPRPFKIERYLYLQDKVYGDIVDVKLVKSNIDYVSDRNDVTVQDKRR